MTSRSSHIEAGNEELMKQLECPICLEYCVPPIYMCKNGHNVCGVCRESLRQCGICREPGQPSIRNLPVEGISRLLVKVKCKNEGCHDFFNLKDLQDHLPKCEFTYECRFDCRWKGKVSDLEMHAVNNHSNFLWDCLKDVNIHLHLIHTQYCYCLTLFGAGGHMFWYTHEYDVVNKMFSVGIVQAKLERERGIDFTFTIDFESKNKRSKCRIESTIAGNETSASKSHISLVNIVDTYKGDKVIPFKFCIRFKDSNVPSDKRSKE